MYKIKDIFTLNLNTRGGVKLFNKIANKYNLHKEDRKDLMNVEIENVNTSGGIEYEYFRVTDISNFPTEGITDGDIVVQQQPSLEVFFNVLLMNMTFVKINKEDIIIEEIVGMNNYSVEILNDIIINKKPIKTIKSNIVMSYGDYIEYVTINQNKKFNFIEKYLYVVEHFQQFPMINTFGFDLNYYKNIIPNCIVQCTKDEIDEYEKDIDIKINI